MTWPAPDVLAEDDEFDGYDDDERKDCDRCNGEGIEDCLDPLDCDAPYCDGYQHVCPGCGGMGLV